MTDVTGHAYLRTFQAFYQLAEIITGFIVWVIVASQPYYLYPPLKFALGALITVWILTLFFYIIYATGAHVLLNAYIAKQKSTGTSDSEATSREQTIAQNRWHVVEYSLYLIMSIFLFIAIICITTQLHNRGALIAACAIGWLLAIMYEIHFCLLFRNVESIWPYEWMVSCFKKCCPRQAENAERERLVISDPPLASTTTTMQQPPE